MTSHPQQTAIVVPVPAADRVVSEWIGDAGAPGMPAHVTVLYPFLPATRITPSVIDELREIVAGVDPFPLSFERFGNFPEVCYLAPEPEQPFREMTRHIELRWPEAPPYGGEHDDVIPHMTLALVTDEAHRASVEHGAQPYLPISMHVSEAWLMEFDGAAWRLLATLPLGTTPVRGTPEWACP